MDIFDLDIEICICFDPMFDKGCQISTVYEKEKGGYGSYYGGKNSEKYNGYFDRKLSHVLILHKDRGFLKFSLTF